MSERTNLRGDVFSPRPLGGCVAASRERDPGHANSLTALSYDLFGIIGFVSFVSRTITANSMANPHRRSFRAQMSASKALGAAKRALMDIRQITYFMLVYEEKSFSKAAAKAKVAQPAVSMQIKHLEEEFSVKFFDRTQAGVEPTEHAKRFYKHCISISKSFSIAQQSMMDVGSRESVGGTLRVGLPGSVTRGLLTRILTPYLANYPDVDVVISEAYTGTLIELVKNGQVDFAIGARPKKQRGLVQRLLYRDGVVLMSGTPLNGPNFTPVDLSLKSGLKLILPSVNQSYGGFVRERIADGTITPERVIEINGTISSAEFARNSDWGVLAPFVSVVNEVAQQHELADMYIYPIINPIIPFDLYLVYGERNPPTLAAKKFIQRIENELKWLRTVWQTLKH